MAHTTLRPPPPGSLMPLHAVKPRWLHCLLLPSLLLLSGALSAQPAPKVPERPIPLPMPPPRLIVPDAEQPIQVASLDARVVIHGMHAETTQTVVFYNPNGRVLEGELEFPLPDGASVSGFALDVGGALVDASVVQKDKARVVLEAEIRKGVDPGLVEVVRGNLYRARVYPIPARGSRTVRLRWVSELATRGGEAAYQLPLPYDQPVGEVALRVEVVRSATQPVIEGGFGNLVLQQWQDRWVAEAKWTRAAPSRDLLVRLPNLPREVVALEPGLQGETFFAVSLLLPPDAQKAAPPPARFALAWDASGSRTADATEKELAFLQALLSAWPQTAVDLVIFRDRPEAPRSFKAGEAGMLISALKAAPNDGGTALARLDLSRKGLPNEKDALWILCSDGLATLGELLPKLGGVPVYGASGSSVADRALLRHLGKETGGELIDLTVVDAPAAVAALGSPRVRLTEVLSAEPGAVDGLQIVERADRSRAIVVGRLLTARAELKLRFGQGRQGQSGQAGNDQRTVLLERKAASAAGERLGPTAVAFGQARAEALALFPDRNAEALLALGRRFGIVTPGTSLLILETLAQHLQHEVEPAASRTEMRAQYLAQIGARDQQKLAQVKNHVDQIASMWQARVAWWKQRFDVPKGFRYGEREPQKESAANSRRDLAAESVAPMPAASAPPPPAPPPRMESAPSSAAKRARAPGGGAASKSVAGGGPAEDEAAPQERGEERSAKKPKDTADSAQASIAIQPWDPKVPYLAPLREAKKGAAYAAYLQQKKQHASPAFYLDCAELLLRGGERELGLRVLTNLAELKLDDPALLRVLAWRLSQAGELDLATWVLEKVLRLRPEEPQSRRDLGLVLADRGEEQKSPADVERAVGLLYEVVSRQWDRFPEIELIALLELNRLVARAERRGWTQQIHSERVDPRLVALLDLDLRVSLSWDADNTDVDLHLFEPTGEHAFFSHNRTAIGGLVSRDFTQGYGPEEYLVKRAVPGQYGVKIHYYGSRQQTLIGPATVIATVFTNYGRADEKKEILTLRLDSPRDMELVGEVTIGASGR